MKQAILLNPGPVVLSDHVRRSLQQPDLCHREPEFFDLQDRIRQRLLDVYALDDADWVAVLLSGSGTSAMEAMVSSLVPADGELLVIENGVYGERLSEIARVHGISHTAVAHRWDQAIDLDRVEQALQQSTELTHLAVAHHETTTGRLNDLTALAELCRRHKVKLLIDGVSSFGAETIDFDQWPIAAVAATANKCLHGIPGLSFVICRRQQLNQCQPRTLYLDLNRYAKAQAKRGTPFTPAFPAFYALDAALQELADQGGWQQRQARYGQLAERVRQCLHSVGIEGMLPTEQSSVVLRSYYLPPGMSYKHWHDYLRDQGFIIYAGQGHFSSEMFRVSTMGQITDQDIDRLCRAMRAGILEGLNSSASGDAA